MVVTLFEYIANLSENKAKTKIRVKIRNAICENTLHAELSKFFYKGSDYYLNSQLSSIDIFDDEFLESFFNALYYFLLTCCGCIMLSLIYTKLAIMMVAAIVLSYVVTRFYDKALERISKKFLNAQSEHMVFILDILNGFLDIYFNQLRNKFRISSQKQAEMYERAYEKYTIQKKGIGVLIYLPMFIIDMLLFSVSVYGIISGETGVEPLVAYVNIGGLILNCSEGFFSCVASLRGGINVLPWDLIFAKKYEIKNSSRKEDASCDTCVLSLKDIRYSRNGKELINIEFLRIRTGQKYLLTGRNGCGKTTLLKLLTKGIIPDSGSVHFRGKDISTLSENDLYSSIAVLPQSGYLFSGSLVENIFFDKDIDPHKCSQVVSASMLTDFVNKHGLDYQITPYGTNISGGEKQKILLARIIAQEKDIILLDEPFVGLDKKAASYFEDYFLNDDLLTVFMISHELPSEAVREKLKVLEGIGPQH